MCGHTFGPDTGSKLGLRACVHIRRGVYRYAGCALGDHKIDLSQYGFILF